MKLISTCVVERQNVTAKELFNAVVWNQNQSSLKQKEMIAPGMGFQDGVGVIGFAVGIAIGCVVFIAAASVGIGCSIYCCVKARRAHVDANDSQDIQRGSASVAMAVVQPDAEVQVQILSTNDAPELKPAASPV